MSEETETPWRELAGLTDTDLPFLDCTNYTNFIQRKCADSNGVPYFWAIADSEEPFRYSS